MDLLFLSKRGSTETMRSILRVKHKVRIGSKKTKAEAYSLAKTVSSCSTSRTGKFFNPVKHSLERSLFSDQLLTECCSVPLLHAFRAKEHTLPVFYNQVKNKTKNEIRRLELLPDLVRIRQKGDRKNAFRFELEDMLERFWKLICRLQHHGCRAFVA